MVQPLIATIAAAVIVTAHRYLNEARQKVVLRRSFEDYFPPSVVRKIMAHPEMIVSGGKKKELTILFSDIKNFTQHSANLSPDQIQKALNEYFEAMVEIVFRHQGTVDKYIGDGLMEFFGDPEPLTDHALQCVLAAIDMPRQTRDLYHRWQREGGLPIEIRVGINTGWVVVGNMGSSRQFSYTVLGAAVNLAQRLESNAPVGGILISERTRQLIERYEGQPAWQNFSRLWGARQSAGRAAGAYAGGSLIISSRTPALTMVRNLLQSSCGYPGDGYCNCMPDVSGQPGSVSAAGQSGIWYKFLCPGHVFHPTDRPGAGNPP